MSDLLQCVLHACQSQLDIMGMISKVFKEHVVFIHVPSTWSHDFARRSANPGKISLILSRRAMSDSFVNVFRHVSLILIVFVHIEDHTSDRTLFYIFFQNVFGNHDILPFITNSYR